jgi:hypothetical protein
VTQVPETAVSPFEEAQRSIQRKQSQDVLAELLELQGQLDLLEVEAWGQGRLRSGTRYRFNRR